MIFVNRSGANDSHLFGDNVSPVQEIFGAGGNVAVHLVSAYGEETLLGGRLDIAAGWMNVENDFASSSLYCNYMNNALCGDPKALPVAISAIVPTPTQYGAAGCVCVLRRIPTSWPASMR